jgi:hypothetical protein
MAKTALALLVCALAAFGSISCGSSDDAPAKCDAFVTKVCMRLVECENSGQTQDQCTAKVNETLNCASAATVKNTYAACLSDLDTISCSDLVGQGATNLPSTCTNVIPPGS